MRITYKHKINALVEKLNKQFEEKITILGEQSGLYILVKVHTQFSEEQLIQNAQQYGVKVYPTSPYFLQQPSSVPIIQLGFSKLKMEEIILGVQLLRKAWITE